MVETGKSKKIKTPLTCRGFSMIEILVVIAIVGVMAAVIFPAVINSLEKRSLESTTKEVLSSLVRAKFQAVRTHLNHRVRFAQESSGWTYCIEREDQANQWNMIREFVKKNIPSDYNVTVNLPNQQVVFSPLGIVTNFSSSQNSITIQSPSLQNYNQPPNRHITVYSGGSVHYSKT
jgi:prepilin-type N-terminal cleavage/methylation domain-containing protein